MGKKVDHNGFWEISKNPLTKTGVFPYLGKQLLNSLVEGARADIDPDKIYKVLRPPTELFSERTLASFAKKPIVIEHEMIGTPEAGLTAPEEKGIHGVIGSNITKEGDTIFGDITIYSESAKEAIENGIKELSAGYFCRYRPERGVYEGQQYDFVQVDVLANHLAIVPKGRMGHDVRVMDSAISEGVFTYDNLDITGSFKYTAGTKVLFPHSEDKNLETKKTNAAKDGVKETKKMTEEQKKALKQALELLATLVSDEKPGESDADKAAKKKAADEKAAKDEKEGAEKAAREKKEAEDKAAQDAAEKASKEKDVAERIKKAEDAAIEKYEKKNTLFNKLSGVIGTFDSKDMSIEKMAKYACDKLNIKLDGKDVEEKDAEATINGFLMANKPETIVGMDTGAGISGSEEDPALDKYLEGK